jgi:hypothetical protein
MAVSLTQTVGSWTASSIKQIPTQTARGAINKAPVQLRVNGARTGVSAAKLRKSSPIKAGVFAAQFQLEEDDDTPCVVTELESCIDFSRYDDFSVKDKATPAELTHVFERPRDISSLYEMGQVLGKGSFGVVRLGRDRANKQLRAVKSLPKLPPQASRQADGEASLSTYLSKLDDEVDAVQLTEGISQSVQYYGSYEDNTHLHIVMEVRSFAARGETISENQSTLIKYFVVSLSSVTRSSSSVARQPSVPNPSFFCRVAHRVFYLSGIVVRLKRYYRFLSIFFGNILTISRQPSVAILWFCLVAHYVFY